MLAVEACRALVGAPEHIRLTYDADGGVSRGTLESVLKMIHEPGARRRAGQLEPARAGGDAHSVRVGAHDIAAVRNPWRAELVTVHDSCGAPNIDTFAAFPASARALMALPRFTGSRVGQWLVDRIIASSPVGPNTEELDAGATYLSAVATNQAGGKVAKQITGPEAYRFTTLTALACAKAAVESNATGVRPPSDLVSYEQLIALPGVEVVD